MSNGWDPDDNDIDLYEAYIDQCDLFIANNKDVCPKCGGKQIEYQSFREKLLAYCQRIHHSRIPAEDTSGDEYWCMDCGWRAGVTCLDYLEKKI